MNHLEKIAVKIRHLPVLCRLNFLWVLIRPMYDSILKSFYRKGLIRVMNGTDSILILPEARNIPEMYEPEFWKRLMQEVREGDVVADVGANIGLYTVTLAKRVGKTGKVIALEPDPQNARLLMKHIELNGVSSEVEVINAAAGDADGVLSFCARSDCSQVIPFSGVRAEDRYVRVQCRTLDGVFHNMKVDVVKIDVEGYEEKVLLGSRSIFERKVGPPRAIFIELHPYAWKKFGTTSKNICSLLTSMGYRLESVGGDQIESTEHYERIWAVALRY